MGVQDEINQRAARTKVEILGGSCLGLRLRFVSWHSFGDKSLVQWSSFFSFNISGFNLARTSKYVVGLNPTKRGT